MGSQQGVVTEVSVAEFFVEIYSTRGNVTLFEVMNPDTQEWVEVSVWDYRKVDDIFWHNVHFIENQITRVDAKLADVGVAPLPKLLRITRFPELERDMVDATYHPSIPSWKIDLVKVKEFLNNGN